MTRLKSDFTTYLTHPDEDHVGCTTSCCFDELRGDVVISGEMLMQRCCYVATRFSTGSMVLATPKKTASRTYQVLSRSRAALLHLIYKIQNDQTSVFFHSKSRGISSMIWVFFYSASVCSAVPSWRRTCCGRKSEFSWFILTVSSLKQEWVSEFESSFYTQISGSDERAVRTDYEHAWTW